MNRTTPHADYHFVSTWKTKAAQSEVEKTIENVSTWPKWWIGLQSVEMLHRADHYVGSRAVLTWRAPLGYQLRLLITITEYDHGSRITFSSEGDLAGTGSWSFLEKGGTTISTITWDVSTTKQWMNQTALLLRPAFIRGHHIIMRHGERGLHRLLAS